MKYILLALVLPLAILTVSCDDDDTENIIDNEFEFVDRTPVTDTIYELAADIESDPVHSGISSDAADDPAIWVHPYNASASIIYGSDKTGGIIAYNLAGEEISFAEVGRINNVDVAYNLELKDENIDIVGGTNRSKDAIDLFKIDPETGELTDILEESVESQVDEVYGFCFYHSPNTGKNYAILNGKNGVIEHYEIIEGGEKLRLQLVSSFDIGGQPEGMVADHKHGYLYIGEENNCIWRVNAEPGNHNPVQIPMSSREDNPNIDYDIEGLTIFYTGSDYGYLIASSQGNNTFAVYDRFPENNYIGSFEIIDGQYDGCSDTDGIDVININLGGKFPFGAFIAQDGKNINDDKQRDPQNFKFVDWRKISGLFEPALYTDDKFNVRTLFVD
jgi:3-phytase